MGGTTGMKQYANKLYAGTKLLIHALCFHVSLLPCREKVGEARMRVELTFPPQQRHNVRTILLLGILDGSLTARIGQAGIGMM